MAQRKVKMSEALDFINQPVPKEISGDEKMEKAALAHGSKENLGKISRELERQSYLEFCSAVHAGFQDGEYSAELCKLDVKVNDKGNVVLKYTWRLADIEVEMPNGSMTRIGKFTICTWESVYTDLFGQVHSPILLSSLACHVGDVEISLSDDMDIKTKWLQVAKAMSEYVKTTQDVCPKPIDVILNVEAVDNDGFATYRVSLVK